MERINYVRPAEEFPRDGVPPLYLYRVWVKYCGVPFGVPAVLEFPDGGGVVVQDLVNMWVQEAFHGQGTMMSFDLVGPYVPR